MPISFNHTIVHASDPQASAKFLSEMLGLAAPQRLAHFVVVKIGDASLDFIAAVGAISSCHFAFLASETEFDAICARIMARTLPFWADPFHREPGRINHWDDGRGLYFDDPDGHLLEIITRPYGSGGLTARHPNPLLTR